MGKNIIEIIIVLFLVTSGCRQRQTSATILEVAEDPLPSWREGPVKNAILSYVNRITDSTKSSFIPVKDRIATFDNDGTLWAEKPLVQELFIKYRVNRMAGTFPELKNREPFRAMLEDDSSYFKKNGLKAIEYLLVQTHTGMTESVFDSAVRDFLSFSVHPLLNVPIARTVYQPQLELIHYLQQNDFNAFICTGGTVDFVRSISESFYGIPKWKVIGSAFSYAYDTNRLDLMQVAPISHVNDKRGKPVGIQMQIGQRPVFACGNEGGAGDIDMLRYSQGGAHPSFQLLIDHDDGVREFAYTEKDSASLSAAKKYGWFVVSMKTDWKTIFPSK